MTALLPGILTARAPITLRAGVASDARALGRILWRARGQSAWVRGHFSRRDCTRFCGRMLARGWIVVALSGGRAVGFFALDGDEVTALYIARRRRGQGLGRKLLAEAKRRRVRLWLRCRADNARALRFYAREGFSRIAGGAAVNEAGLQEVILTWVRKERE